MNILSEADMVEVKSFLREGETVLDCLHRMRRDFQIVSENYSELRFVAEEVLRIANK